jgi:hypothetical protein
VSNPPKQKGTSWETAIKNWLALHGYLARRKPLTGNKDTGDLEIEGIPWLVIEAKNVQKVTLGPWVDEAETEAENADAEIGVVWHHRPRKGSPGDAFVTMSGDTFFKLLRRLTPPVNLN